MLYRAQIAFQVDSALPRDAMTINPHYDGSDAQGLADRLKSNLIAQPNIGATTPFTVKIYQADKAPPSFPLATAEQTGTPKTTTTPREIALCLSYYAQWNRPGFRGRLYLPVWIVGGGLALRPTQTQRDNCIGFKSALTGGLPSGTFWIVYSRKNKNGAQVTNVWCDDEWDVLRSRGLKGTARSLGTAPQDVSRPYSTRFILSNVAQVWVQYAVPAGYRAVVKVVSFTQTGSTPGFCWAQIAGITIGSWSAPGSLGGVILNMAHVAYAGEVIRLYSGAVNIEAACSGYLLTEDALALEDPPEITYEDPAPLWPSTASGLRDPPLEAAQGMLRWLLGAILMAAPGFLAVVLGWPRL